MCKYLQSIVELQDLRIFKNIGKRGMQKAKMTNRSFLVKRLEDKQTKCREVVWFSEVESKAFKLRLFCFYGIHDSSTNGHVTERIRK